ncbi:MAG TPA: MFS transporter [Bryobacteraceae bacterium]|jgi:MFS family permease|nr:MFS transporter [Bryobacteraceae bacterium]
MVATCFVTLGLAVGVPYYNLPFFFDYFQRSFHWDLKQITLGFPAAAVLTIWIAPLLVPRFSQRKLIVLGTGLTALSFFGFGLMTGSVPVYFALYFLYAAGYMFSGPIPHQILVSHWFRRKRGLAMGLMYVGVGLFGGLGSMFVSRVTGRFGFQTALFFIGVVLLVTWPLALFVLRDQPSEYGEFPDGAGAPSDEQQRTPHTYRRLLGSVSFWLLLLGSICSIGAIGSITQHMKLVFRDAGFHNQLALNSAWTTASTIILWSSIVGRIGIGYLADVFSKKIVMTATYFIVAATILLLLAVSPGRPGYLYGFALLFGIGMGADYMLIPLMAAEQFGVNTLARAMAIILPVNTIGQTWLPFFVSALRERFGNYVAPMAVVFAIAMAGALAIALIPQEQVGTEKVAESVGATRG